MLKYSVTKLNSNKFKNLKSVYSLYESKSLYPSSFICLVKDKTEVVAHLIFREYLEFPNIWELERIFVSSNYRNKKIGLTIISKVLSFIESKNGIKVLVFVSKTNKVAQKFYIKNKFKKEAEIKKMKLGKESLFIYTKEI